MNVLYYINFDFDPECLFTQIISDRINIIEPGCEIVFARVKLIENDVNDLPAAKK